MRKILKCRCAMCGGQKYIIITKKEKFDLLIQCPICENGLMSTVKENDEN